MDDKEHTINEHSPTGNSPTEHSLNENSSNGHSSTGHSPTEHSATDYSPNEHSPNGHSSTRHSPTEYSPNKTHQMSRVNDQKDQVIESNDELSNENSDLNDNLNDNKSINELNDNLNDETIIKSTAELNENGLNWMPDNHQENDEEDENNSDVLVKQETLDNYGDKINEKASECDTNEDEMESKQQQPNSTTESYTDFGGVNLEEFLFNLLQNNVKDRFHLLRIEQELINLIKDEQRTSLRFPSMSSYHRMLVHRVAAYFGFEHNIDAKGNCVIVNKQEGITRIPELRFKDQIDKLTITENEEPKKLILKRDTNSSDDNFMNDNRFDGKGSNGSERKSKSFEEREEQYEKVRARIFSQQTSKNDSNALGNLNESDKCNLDNQSNLTVNSNLSTMNTKYKSDESFKNFNNNFTNFDSGQASYLNPNYSAFDNLISDHQQFNPYLNSNSQFNHHEFKSNNHQLNSIKTHPNGDVIDSSKGFYKSNGYKGGKLTIKNSLKNGGINKSINNQNQQQQQQHFYTPNLPPQMMTSIEQQQLYSNWLPPDLNAQQDCFAKQQQLYQPLAFNQVAHPNQQKLYLLYNNYPGNYTEPHSFNNDKMVPNQMVLQSAAMNHLSQPVNGQQQGNNTNKNNPMEKENLNAYVASQMSNLTLGAMSSSNAGDINDVQARASGIPICYLKSPYYPITGPNHPNDMIYQNSLAQRAHLSNQQMLLINPNFNSNTPTLNNNFNRQPANSILPVPAQSINMTNNQRFTNLSNYQYTVNGSNGSTSHHHLEMNQMYSHIPPYLSMPNTIRPPLLPTPPKETTLLKQQQPKHSSSSNTNNVPKKKTNVDQSNEQMNGFIKNDRKKLNGFKNELNKKSSPTQTQQTTKSKTSSQAKPIASNNGTTSRIQNNALSNKVG